MIHLPTRPVPHAMDVMPIDMGGILRGAASLRIDRPGNRYSISFKYPPMDPEITRTFTGRLQRAKREGIEVKIPLLVPQGIPGAPVVDGAVTDPGSTITVRGLNPGYAAKEGFWLTIIEADGSAYLHSMAATTVADSSGDAVFEIEPPLRAPFADGDTIEMGAPFIQGFISGDNLGWSVDPERITEISFAVEEYA